MKKVLLLLADGFEAVEASVFTDVLGWNNLEGDGTTQVVTAGLHDRLKCTWNFTVIPEVTLDSVKVEDYDALAIPGGFEEAGFYNDGYDSRFSKIIQEFHEQGKWIATICVAALTLGKAGVLEGRRATTYDHPTSIRKSQLRNFGAHVVDEQIVVDGNLITSCNPATAFDVAFTLLEKLTSLENTLHVKELMGFTRNA